MMKRVLAITLLVVGVSNLFAQDFKQDLLNISKRYLYLDKFKITAHIENIEQNGNTLKNKYEVWKWGKQFLQKNKDFEVLLNDKFLIVLTKSDKHISYAYAEDIPYNEKEQLTEKADYTKIIDNYFEKYDSVKFNGLVNGVKFYRIYSNKFDAKWLDISFDEKTYLINKLVYFYDKEKSFSTLQRMTVRFNHQTLDSYPKIQLSHNEYIKVIGNKIDVSSNYQTYSISQKNYFSR